MPQLRARRSRRIRRPGLAILTLSLLVAALASAASAGAAASAADSPEKVVLVPEDAASWRPSRLLAWLRPDHNYGDRTLTIETTPPGATVDLFYVRSNFQKRYEQAIAPVKVVLPQRVEAGPRDAVNVRAFLEGYRQQQTSVRVGSSKEHLHLELEPLPNTLVAASHVYLAGRGSLAFLTEETLQVRVQEREGGFNVILAETAKGEKAGAELESMRSPLVEGVEALQLGEDLLVRIDTPPGRDLELRARQRRNELRDLYVYAVDLVPADGGAAAVQRARAALADIGSAQVTGCAAVFDERLREALDPADLARALSPQGAFTDRYLRAAMKRLGEVSPGGRIAMLDGTRFHPGRPIELSAALGQPADAEGFLALLRAFVRRLEPEPHRAETLRGLVAPEMGADAFGAALAAAEEAEARCRAAS